MGIDFHVLSFLSSISSREFGNTLTIGRQSIHLSKTDLKSLVQSGKVTDSLNLLSSKYIDDYLRSEFGAVDVASLDMSRYEDATIQHDLNRKINENLRGKFDTIIDSGSLEHVFDTHQAFFNLISMCRVGGRIIHVSPTDNFSGHGFWQISPELFFSLYSAENGFEIENLVIASLADHKYHFKVHKPIPGHRITIYSHSPIYVMANVRKIHEVKELIVMQSDYKFIWNENASTSNELQSKMFFTRLRRLIPSIKSQIRLIVSPSRNFFILNKKNAYISPFRL